MRIHTLNKKSVFLIGDGVEGKGISYHNTSQGRADLTSAGLSAQMYDQIMEVWGEEPAVIDTPVNRGDVRAAKLTEVGDACKVAIYAGVEIDGERYALTEADQINISTAQKAVEGGAEHFLYHADGNLCEPFPAVKILAIIEAVTRHKIYHTTYCNHLNVWIRRAEAQELEGIFYGAELPPDLAEHMRMLLEGATA